MIFIEYRYNSVQKMSTKIYEQSMSFVRTGAVKAIL